MRKIIILILLGILVSSVIYSQQETDREKVCVLKTTMGTMVFRFFEDDAPNTSKQIQDLVQEGFYEGRVFYRVVKGHVIQTGGGGENLKAEFNKNPHVKGTVGLARSDDPDSGDSSFYICLAPRPHLDEKYTVFGELIEGFDVLDAIEQVEVNEKFVGANNEVAYHEPKKPVIIEEALIELREIKKK